MVECLPSMGAGGRGKDREGERERERRKHAHVYNKVLTLRHIHVKFQNSKNSANPRVQKVQKLITAH